VNDESLEILREATVICGKVGLLNQRKDTNSLSSDGLLSRFEFVSS
jgi:hypothetical protein